MNAKSKPFAHSKSFAKDETMEQHRLGCAHVTSLHVAETGVEGRSQEQFQQMPLLSHAALVCNQLSHTASFQLLLVDHQAEWCLETLDLCNA